jgi:threonine-phosphate decarboxylase
MTKFYSAAGIRVGAIISSSKNIRQLNSKEPLWKISQFDSYYLQSAFRDKTFIERSNILNSKNKIYLISMLKNYTFIAHIYPSSVNFVMLKLKDIDATTFQMQLKPYKIMVRNCANFDCLDDRYVRIAVKDIELLYMLKETLCKIYI